MKTNNEPKEAFPYQTPDENIKTKYKEIFQLNEPIQAPALKLMFDKIIAIIILVICFPVTLLLFIANFIEGIIISENRGPLFFYYNAVSAGKAFKKYTVKDQP